jgi:hypothetical protein
VDRPRDDFLPRAGLAGDQNRTRRARQADPDPACLEKPDLQTG